MDFPTKITIAIVIGLAIYILYLCFIDDCTGR
jgi:hypothetical protein